MVPNGPGWFALPRGAPPNEIYRFPNEKANVLLVGKAMNPSTLKPAPEEAEQEDGDEEGGSTWMEVPPLAGFPRPCGPGVTDSPEGAIFLKCTSFYCARRFFHWVDRRPRVSKRAPEKMSEPEIAISQ